MAVIGFAVESFRDTAQEAWPLIQTHAAEVGLDAMERPFQPNWERYFELEERGVMFWISCRTGEGELAGYAMWYLMPSLLHLDLTLGANEAFFLVKKYRNGYTLKRLMRFCEAELRRRGAVRLSLELWMGNRVGPLIEKLGLGYEHRKSIYWGNL